MFGVQGGSGGGWRAGAGGHTEIYISRLAIVEANVSRFKHDVGQKKARNSEKRLSWFECRIRAAGGMTRDQEAFGRILIYMCIYIYI